MVAQNRGNATSTRRQYARATRLVWLASLVPLIAAIRHFAAAADGQRENSPAM
jgi:hypothetical protein